ncbi:metalloregulator ArsR/SmtB family transcription factor [Pelotomaculum isophthalicicum JI]|uniref:Metalloregulator ArsR/SmtB family transcription factor n=1 Tax=Pelotomaculum isophthalicicum JI TaxID=947010 RepID=A0A9X4H3G0_9FIRM|nr:metalloregulator ArsR/SmtB family transcription factor [Pelotomaculum isophthalicicum]MDF9409636.1 metalloregulator ArsR/SmtB family transcription factor [Pelotomaculum isophthalicicum JI]
MISIFKALGDSHRLNILKMLARQEMGACEVITAIGLSQPAIAHHLKILKQAGLINSEKEGKIVFYTLNKDGIKEFYKQMDCFLEELSCFSCSQTKSSPLRQNPNLCTEMGFDPEVCEKEISETK